jgi:hypothetical protein
MRNAVRRHMKWAKDNTERLWPILAPLVGGGELVPNEDAIADQSSQLDMISGIDWYIQRTANGLPINIPLASRTQVGCWTSHTTRTERDYGAHTPTELHRRRNEAITPYAETPQVNLQLYVDSYQSNSELVIAGVTEEIAILETIDAGYYTPRRNEQELGYPVDFYAVWWADITRVGHEVRYMTGTGVHLASQHKPLPQPFKVHIWNYTDVNAGCGAERRRRPTPPCKGCGYYWPTNGTHRADCTANDPRNTHYCRNCNEELIQPESIRRGTCLECHLFPSGQDDC